MFKVVYMSNYKFKQRLYIIECLIHLIIKYKLRTGLPEIRGFLSERPLILNPILVNIVLILLCFRNSILLYENNEYLSKLMADFTYNWVFGIQWKLTEIFTWICLIFMEINTYINHRSIETSRILAKELYDIKIEDKLLKYFKLLSMVLFSCCCIVGVLLYLLLSIYIFEFTLIYLISLIWIIIWALGLIYLEIIIIWHTIAFNLYCYRSYIIIKYQNNRLIKMGFNRIKINKY